MKHPFQLSSYSSLVVCPNPKPTDRSRRSRAIPADNCGEIWELLCPDPRTSFGRFWFSNILQAVQAGIPHWLATAQEGQRWSQWRFWFCFPKESHTMRMTAQSDTPWAMLLASGNLIQIMSLPRGPEGVFCILNPNLMRRKPQVFSANKT